MRGLLLKDLYIARSNVLVSVVGIIVIGFGLAFLMESSTLLVLAPAISTTAVYISITSDAASKWNKAVITMPVSRKQIIGEKYLLYIALALLGMTAAIIPCLILAFLRNDVTWDSLVLYGTLGFSISFMAGSISLICAYLFDPEKTQITFMLSFVAASVITAAIVLITNLFIPVKDHIVLAFSITLVISILLFFLSYRISMKLYSKMDIR